MIVKIKKQLAQIILTILNRKVKIVTSMFEEDNANKPQSDNEVRVYHTGDTLQKITSRKATYVRNYQFQIEVSVKNIRMDDEVQQLVDLIIFGLMDATITNMPVNLEQVINDGQNDNGIWKYLIRVVIPIPIDSLSPEVCNFECEEFSFNEIQLDIHPSYTIPLIPPL